MSHGYRKFSNEDYEECSKESSDNNDDSGTMTSSQIRKASSSSSSSSSSATEDADDEDEASSEFVKMDYLTVGKRRKGQEPDQEEEDISDNESLARSVIGFTH